MIVRGGKSIPYNFFIFVLRPILLNASLDARWEVGDSHLGDHIMIERSTPNSNTHNSTK